MTTPKIAVLIVAAGRGHRAGGALPKQYLPMGRSTILSETINSFQNSRLIDFIQVVIHPDDRALYDNATTGLSLPEPCHGGATRQDSVRLGLEALANENPDLVLVHDAARPFVSRDVIERVTNALNAHDAVIPSLPVTDTIKQVDGSQITGSIDRNTLRRAQTPQGFRFRALLDAHRAQADGDLAGGPEKTDDAAIMEAAGIPVHVVEGDERNIKITTPEDVLTLADGKIPPLLPRTGTGYDVHRLGDGDHVMLCGVRIAHDQGLIGHSDADVALHALTDALLGAAGAGDIGRHFPPSDPQWKGAPSHLFVEKAVDLIADKGGHVGNVDITIICEAPKVTPHVGAMTDVLTTLLRLSPDAINVKATTTEKLGFTGRGEGIAAQAAATIFIPGTTP